MNVEGIRLLASWLEIGSYLAANFGMRPIIVQNVVLCWSADEQYSIKSLRILECTEEGFYGRAYGNYEDFDVFAGADTAEKVRINGYDENKFFANGVEVEGAIICLSRLTLKWTPKSFDEITPESLAIFELLRPAPEILILGCGKRMGRVSNELRDYLRSNGIKLEAIDTANATSTFNILNEEGRIVAAAMLPQGT